MTVCLIEPGSPYPGPAPPAGLAVPTPADPEGLLGLERSEVAQGLLEKSEGQQGSLTERQHSLQMAGLAMPEGECFPGPRQQVPQQRTLGTDLHAGDGP